MLNNRKFIVLFLGYILIAYNFFACSSENIETQSNIPYVPVDVRIDFDSISADLISLPNTYLYLNGGYKGIVLFHTLGNEYIAYDRACPYDINESCALIEVDGITNFVDKCCHTLYNIFGAVIRSPGTIPLKRYSTSLDPNSNILYITN